MNFKFQSHDEYANDKTVKSFDADHLEDILEQFQLFLAGVGFVYDGNLEFVPEDDTWKDYTPVDDKSSTVHADEETFQTLQSSDAWKWTVNELNKTGTVTAGTVTVEPSGPNAN